MWRKPSSTVSWSCCPACSVVGPCDFFVNTHNANFSETRIPFPKSRQSNLANDQQFQHWVYLLRVMDDVTCITNRVFLVENINPSSMKNSNYPLHPLPFPENSPLCLKFGLSFFHVERYACMYMVIKYTTPET